MGHCARWASLDAWRMARDAWRTTHVARRIAQVSLSKSQLASVFVKACVSQGTRDCTQRCQDIHIQSRSDPHKLEEVTHGSDPRWVTSAIYDRNITPSIPISIKSLRNLSIHWNGFLKVRQTPRHLATSTSYPTRLAYLDRGVIFQRQTNSVHPCRQ